MVVYSYMFIYFFQSVSITKIKDRKTGYANSSQVTIKSMQFQSLVQMTVDFLRKLREDTAWLCEIA